MAFLLVERRTPRRIPAVVAAWITAAWMAAAPVHAAPVAVVPATGPAAGQQQPERQKPDEAFLQAQRRQRDATRTQFASLRQVGPVSPDAACRFSLERGLLHVETTPLAGPDQARLRVEGSDAIWVASRRPAPAVVVGV